jgi:hypothetical protein
MTNATKDATLSVRLPASEKSALEAHATLRSSAPGTLAAGFVREGLRRDRFPAVDFRNGHPGRVAYLTGTRWPVWMIADLVEELDGNLDKAARRVRRPAALVKMAVRYAEAYPDEIAAARQLVQDLEAAA